MGVFAVHISDGVLTPTWQASGFLLAAALALFGAWRIRDEEIPRVALLTAAFFVASFIHVRVGSTSVHLLLNGLMGVVLGRRAALAIPVGTALQALLTQHGGYLTIGVNSCVMTLPALLAWQVFGLLRRVPWIREPWLRTVLVFFSCLVWMVCLIFGTVLLVSNYRTSLSGLDISVINTVTLHSIGWPVAVSVSALAAWCERRLENAPEFPLGMLVGEFSVLLTTLLNALVLVWGGQEDWPSLVLITVVPHVLIAVLEGVVLGFTVGFLARVKPEMVGWSEPEEAECLADSAA